MIYNYHKIKFKISQTRSFPGRVAFLLLIVLSFSCETDIEKVRLVTDNTVYPALVIYNGHITYTDSGLVVAVLNTKELKRYDLPDDPYSEFPQGMEVIFYNKDGSQKAIISCNYAIYWQAKELWEAKNDVKGSNDKGEKLNTEQMFWNQKTGKIYSEKFTKIETDDGVFYGKKGFEAEQDFSKWKLKRSEGTVNIKEEESEEPGQ